MATRKPVDDVTAREAVETKVADALGTTMHEAIDSPMSADPRAAAKTVVGGFKYAEQESTVTRVAGGEVKLRRYVLTTDWEVAQGA
jgi:hypothetical protein